MTAPENRGSGDDGNVPAPREFLRDLLERAAQLLREAVLENRPADFEHRRTRLLEIAEAVRRNG